MGVGGRLGAFIDPGSKGVDSLPRYSAQKRPHVIHKEEDIAT